MNLQIKNAKKFIALIAMVFFCGSVFSQVPLDLQLSNVHVSGGNLNFTVKFRGGAGYSSCGYSLGGTNIYIDVVYPNNDPALRFPQVSGVPGTVPEDDPIFYETYYTIMTSSSANWRIGLSFIKNINQPATDIDENNYFIMGTYSIPVVSGDPTGAVLKIRPITETFDRSVWHGNHIASGAKEQPLLNQPYNPTKLAGFPIESGCPAQALWTGAFDTDWHDVDNWVNPANGTPAGIPCATTNVYIPGSGYRGDALGPVVPIHLPTLSANANCNEITFFQGGQLGRLDLLNYNKARVQLNFPGGNQGSRYYNSSSADPTAYYKFAKGYSSPELTAGHWHMLSLPLQGVYSGDLGYGGFPMTFMRKFNVEKDDEMENYISGDWSESYKSTTEKLNSAEGFAFYMYPQGTSFGTVYSANDNKNIAGSVTNYGLGATSGIIEFPTYDNTYKLNSHRIQRYSGGSSIFYDVAINGDLGEILDGSTPIARNSDDYRFATESGGVIANEFTYDIVGGTGYVLVGNPYMATLNFEEFRSNNSHATRGIQNNYQIWNGTSFETYVIGGTGTSPGMTRYIPPMQGFFVKTNNTSTTAIRTLTLSPEYTTVPPKGTNVRLRSTEENTEQNIIRLSAINQYATTNALIVQKNDAGVEYKSGEDITKLFSPYKSVDKFGNVSYSTTPEIYSLAGENPLSINYIGESGAIVPIGIRVAPSGSTTLKLTGMNNYNATKIELLDNNGQFLADLTKKGSFEYEFNNGEAGYQSGRFYLRIAESTTGTGNIEAERIQVYKANEGIQVISSPNDLIKQIQIYDIQGRILYNNTDVAMDIYSVKEQFDKQQILIVQVITEKKTESVKLKN